MPGVALPTWAPGGRWGIVREASVTAKAIPRHARMLEWQCWGYWGPGPGEGSIPGVQNPGAELRLNHGY
jgi:hypothetical protein